MTLSDLLVQTYVPMLGTLSQWLTKAEAQQSAEGAHTLPAARLAPDMFPLATQVRFACRQALEGVFRLQGRAFSPLFDTLIEEGRNAGERPGSLADARARIEETLAVVKDAAGQSAAVDPSAPLEHALPNGMVLDLTAEQYARDWALPQFYFHVVTAYAILRAQGVELGKADFVAHMAPHIRPPSA